MENVRKKTWKTASELFSLLAEAIFKRAKTVSNILFITGTKPLGNLVIKYSTRFGAKKNYTNYLLTLHSQKREARHWIID